MHERRVISSDSWARLPGIYSRLGLHLALEAIAALLAQALDVPEAVKEAQEYTWQTLNAGFRPGMGTLFRIAVARTMNPNRNA